MEYQDENFFRLILPSPLAPPRSLTPRLPGGTRCRARPPAGELPTVLLPAILPPSSAGFGGVWMAPWRGTWGALEGSVGPELERAPSSSSSPSSAAGRSPHGAVSRRDGGPLLTPPP